VENEDPVHVRPLGLRLRLRDDRGARTALLVSTLAIIVGHASGPQDTDRKVSFCKGESHGRSIAFRVCLGHAVTRPPNIIKTSAHPFEAANSHTACPVPGQGQNLCDLPRRTADNYCLSDRNPFGVKLRRLSPKFRSFFSLFLKGVAP